MNHAEAFVSQEVFIKALGCCEQRRCDECPVHCISPFCISFVQKGALNLIKKQQAEINRLKKYDEERDIRLHARLIANAKNEAIKEFWNRLKAQNTMDERIISVKSGDDLVKEMVGEK